MKIIIVRHAETRWNTKEILQSLTNNPLSNIGIKNAKKTAELLKNEKIDLIISSDLKRTIQTAKIINKNHKSKHLATSLITERNFGDLEGIAYDKYQKIMKNSDENNLHDEYGVEKIIKLENRIKKFWKYVLNEHKNKNILIVSHGATIKMLLSIILNEPFEEIRKINKKNASYSIIELDDNFNVKKQDLAIDSHLD